MDPICFFVDVLFNEKVKVAASVLKHAFACILYHRKGIDGENPLPMGLSLPQYEAT